jgi:succinate dehydrogenase/fumarate reductase flavoprotein subunit
LNIQTEWRDYDVLVVGSGGAGSHAARAASEAGAKVLVLSKDPIGCSDTKISEGIATVRQCSADDDSEQTLSENLRMAGADLPLSKITDAFATDSIDAYDQYRINGLRPPIDTERQTPKALPLPMGGHNRRRSVGHANSGIAFGHASCDAVIANGGIDYLEDNWFIDLVKTTPTDEHPAGDVIGGISYDAARGCLVAIRAPSVIIAAGGLSTLYFPKTDTMRGNTGDSYAIAARAGAELVDMEQVQFLPFCLTSPPSYEGLLCGEPVTASFLGVLRDNNGKVILDGVYLRTRAECSAAIMRAVEEGRGSPNGGAWLDMTANKTPPRSGPYFMKFLETALPSAYRNARQALGKAAAKCDEAWEVRPGAHYHMGGIRVDENGASVSGIGDGDSQSGIHGLFAAGQAMGGLFGANRLGSTSLTEVAVFGSRAGNAAASRARQVGVPHHTDSQFNDAIDAATGLFGQAGTTSAAKIRLELQQASWMAIGPLRSADKLQAFQADIERWENQLQDISIPGYTGWNQSFIDYQELRNMLETAKAVSAASLQRDCSVGGHVRLDGKEVSLFSAPYSTLVHLDNGGVQSRRTPRARTPFARAIAYKFTEKKARLKATLLRLMPATLQDKHLEKRYRAIMGASGAAPMMPGGTEAATADAGNV